MNRLREMLATKQGGLPMCVTHENNSCLMLFLQPWQGIEWVLPWSRLESAKLSHEEQFERIDLQFTNHEVLVLGEKLHWYREELSLHKISRFKSYPAAYRMKFQDSDSFISHLEIRLLAEPDKRPSGGLPF
ncbi:hypothetical protein CMV30_03695 [Nibricoccus aquaticus]|uniref:Uncharacterized protein n=1 Tax=Nibricoccus aquaticus TaxID=2576891 RepID=A0A290Q383_9BACT|nr:hypothetical protein [Nibricoccus aquaticus]ATC63129.1 hypothetical protein CMV30_03695 [Nibricoccus aquaticus]